MKEWLSRDEFATQVKYHSNAWEMANAEEMDRLAAGAATVASEIARAVSLPIETLRAVDLGAGRGNILHALRREGFDAVGCEPSETLSRLGRRAYLLDDSVLETAGVQDFLARRGDKERFDVVVLWHVLEHLPNPCVVFSEIRSRLNEGGLIFVELPLPVPEHLFNQHRFLATPRSGIWLAEKFNLKVVEVAIIKSHRFVRYILSCPSNPTKDRTNDDTFEFGRSDWGDIRTISRLYADLKVKEHIKSAPRKSARVSNVSSKFNTEQNTPNQTNVILHIGFDCVASSVIQKYFNNNKIRLRERKIIYPQSLLKSAGHIEVGAALFPCGKSLQDLYSRDQILSHYAKIARDAPIGTTFVLSDDRLCQADSDPTAVQDLKEAFRDFDLYAVAYVRHPIDFLVFLYHEFLIQGNAVEFDEYIEEFTDPKSAQFDRRLKVWRDVFGSEKILVRNCDNIKTESIVDDFLETIGKGDLVPSENCIRPDCYLHPWLQSAFKRILGVNRSPQARQRMKDALMRASQEMPAINAGTFYLGEERYKKLLRHIQQC